MPNSELKIASRLYFSQEGKERHSRPAVRVALAGIIVGVMVMILTICIVVGFKQTVTAKIAGFGAHIQLVSFDNNNTYDLQSAEGLTITCSQPDFNGATLFRSAAAV